MPLIGMLLRVWLLLIGSISMSSVERFQQRMPTPWPAVLRHMRYHLISTPRVPLGDVVIEGFDQGVHASPFNG
jgi:hypothetical protein